MAERRPLSNNSGSLKEFEAGDTLPLDTLAPVQSIGFIVANNLQSANQAAGILTAPLDLGLAYGGSTDWAFVGNGAQALFTGTFDAVACTSLVHAGNNGSRTRIDARLAIAGVAVLGTNRIMYLRNSGFGSSAVCATPIPFAITAGQIVTVQTERIAGTGDYFHPALGSGATTLRVFRRS